MSGGYDLGVVLPRLGGVEVGNLISSIPIELWCREDEAAAILQTKNFDKITVDELLH